MAQWYEELFENYADSYERESFTSGTVAEVDFIHDELALAGARTVLDIGCGTGRHSIVLASRGYRMTGVDLSENMLSRARKNASARGVHVDFIRRDARELGFRAEFDAAIMLCEGAFPLMETDEMNYLILKGAATALKGGGLFIFTTLNGLFPLANSTKDFINDSSHETAVKVKEAGFDLMTFRDVCVNEFTDDAGVKHVITSSERYYMPSEITWLLKCLGFSSIEIFGCDIGSWRRGRALAPADFEMLVIAQK